MARQVGSKAGHSSQILRSLSVVLLLRKMKYGASMMDSCISSLLRFGHCSVLYSLHRLKMSSVFIPCILAGRKGRDQD